MFAALEDVRAVATIATAAAAAAAARFAFQERFQSRFLLLLLNLNGIIGRRILHLYDRMVRILHRVNDCKEIVKDARAAAPREHVLRVALAKPFRILLRLDALVRKYASSNLLPITAMGMARNTAPNIIVSPANVFDLQFVGI